LAAPLERHLALIGFMGAGKSRLGAEVAQRLGRPFVDLDREIESASGRTIPDLFVAGGEPAFRVLEAEAARRELRRAEPAVIALGGGAVETEGIVNDLRDRAVAALLEIDVGEAWRRVGGRGRPLAADEASFRALYQRRAPVYREVADSVVRDADDAVLAAGGVEVGLGGIERLGSGLHGGRPVALVADAHVAGIHGALAQLALGAALAETHELPAGEEAKTLEAVERLWRALRLPRGGALVALGGGSVTDAAGFVAATYLRGIPWLSVPTTLVGQVDAGIGGKTAIDLPEGKNLVGAFHWPVRTVIDPGLLATLPPEEVSEGMAEVVKTGLLAGEPLWELPQRELVRRCAAYKTAICMRDPQEHGERKALNLGHTFAHALEAASDYRLRHGEALALGLLAALRLSGLPTDVVEEVLSPRPVRVDTERAWAALGRDKKTANGRPQLVLLERPGLPRTNVELPEAEIRAALSSLIRG
jgi:shikimate kinase / 3-dehydroquinate synthase